MEAAEIADPDHAYAYRALVHEQTTALRDATPGMLGDVVNLVCLACLRQLDFRHPARYRLVPVAAETALAITTVLG